MNHLAKFKPRDVLVLPLADVGGWTVKRYAIVAENRRFDASVAEAALACVPDLLPAPGQIDTDDGNHGIAVQIVHFAEVAVVSPIVYWHWGSVLSHPIQLRAPWDNPTRFRPGVQDVLGCVWEMEIIAFEVEAWKTTVLSGEGSSIERVERYLQLRPKGAQPPSKKAQT